MENLIGKITAELIAKEATLPEGLIDSINNNIHPPQPVVADDIYIRAMYIVSDQVNSYGGKFPADEHPCLMELLIDAPVLVGHRKDSLPIARNFHAEPAVRDGVNWIKVYFYWLKSAVDAEDLRCNIDGGIYKECSISFIFSFPECSICGEDMRHCRHRPFERYNIESGEKETAYFNYRQIEKVLETSLVYRGSIDDTALTKELVFRPDKDDDKKGESNAQPLFLFPFRRIWDLEFLSEQEHCLVMPAYESIPVILCREKSATRLLDGSGTAILGDTIKGFLRNLKLPDGDYVLSGRLIGYRGKERQPVAELFKYIKGETTPVRRMEIKISDIFEKDGEPVQLGLEARRQLLEGLFSANSNLLLPAIIGSGTELNNIVADMATRYGAEILCSASREPLLYTHRKLLPAKIENCDKRGKRYHYQLSCHIDGTAVRSEETVVSSQKYEIGDNVEIEIYSLYRGKEGIKLIHPRIVDRLAGGNQIIDIAGEKKDIPNLDAPITYNLQKSPDGALRFIPPEKSGVFSFIINHYDPNLLSDGRRFLADKISGREEGHAHFGDGTMMNFRKDGDSAYLRLDGAFAGNFLLRPVILKGEKRYLFHKIDSLHYAESGNGE
jgi:hypothetical protein